MLYSEYTDTLTNYLKDINKNPELNKQKLKELGLLRDFSPSLLEKLGVVYIGDSISLMHPRYTNVLDKLGIVYNGSLIYHNRYLIPIPDVYGKVVGLVGYSPTSKRRYIYANGEYYNRRNTFYGLHNLENIVDKGFVIVVEGVTDLIALYNIGIYNVVANCGTHRNRLGEDLVSRLKYGAILIPDTDIAGQRAYSLWDYHKNKVKLELTGYKDISEYLHNASYSKVSSLKASLSDCEYQLKHRHSLGLYGESVNYIKV